MMNELLKNRYKVERELKPAGDGNIYWLVTDQHEGQYSFQSSNIQKSLF
jgi:hypothetical protein